LFDDLGVLLHGLDEFAGSDLTFAAGSVADDVQVLLGDKVLCPRVLFLLVEFILLERVDLADLAAPELDAVHVQAFSLRLDVKEGCGDIAHFVQVASVPGADGAFAFGDLTHVSHDVEPG
jgi:hypothetical protein